MDPFVLGGQERDAARDHLLGRTRPSLLRGSLELRVRFQEGSEVLQLKDGETWMAPTEPLHHLWGP